MTRFAALIALPLLFLPLQPIDTQAQDRAAVERAVQDYVEALYQAEPALIERSVHPALTKRGSWRPPEASEYATASLMSYEQLYDLAGRWNADGQQGEDLSFSIDVFDVLDVSAAAKLSADWGIEYMHLTKIKGQWKIIHILWQSHPPKG